MEYHEKEGAVLKGFSQIDLDTLNQNLKVNNQLIKRQTVVYGIIGFIFLLIMLWGIWQIKHYQIITKLINALGG